MVEQIYVYSLRKIINGKKQIERAFNIKLSNKAKIVFLEGEPGNEMLALSAVEAMELGFDVDDAILLKNDEIVFEKIQIKTLTHRKNLEEVRGRIIGTQRRVLNTIEDLTDCYIRVHDNTVGIIGRIQDIEKAIYAIRKIITGSEHASVYAYLEEQKVLERQQL